MNYCRGELTLLDAASGVDALRALAQESSALDVYTLQLSRVSLLSLSTQRHKGLLQALPKFSALTTLRASACELSAVQVAGLLDAACALTGLQDLTLSGNAGVTDGVMQATSASMPSVRFVALMRTPLTDAALPHLARIFGNVAGLHLAQTVVQGHGLRELIASNSALRELGLDGTRLSEEGVGEIYAAVVERSEALEVRMRGVGTQSTAWLPLLELAGRSRVRKRLWLRHDLQACSFGEPGPPPPAPGRVQTHAKMQLHVHVNGYVPFVVVLSEVPGTRPIEHIASEALSEFNLFCVGDDSAAVGGSGLGNRRAAYRAAFAHLGGEVELFGHKHQLECLSVSWGGGRDGEERIDLDARGKLAGPGRAGRTLQLHFGVAR